MAAYLKVIGSGKEPASNPYTKPYADFSPSRPPNRIHEGDYLVLYSAGGLKRVFAVAQVISSIKASDDKEWPYRLNIRYEVNVPPAEGVPANHISTERELTRSVMRQTCIKLSDEEFNRAWVMLNEAKKEVNEE